MPIEDRNRLAARTFADYVASGGSGYVPLLPADFAAAANLWADYLQFLAAGESAQVAAQQAAAAAAAAQAGAQAISGGAGGVGIDAFDVPRVSDLGTAAFYSADAMRGQWPTARGAAYQITPVDYGRTLIAETGTLTWTLPRLADLAPGWWVNVWNRSGATLTIARSGADVIGASVTSVTVADGSGATLAYRDGARFERIG